MRKVKRWRYYCDFCGKSGGSKYHMENHERSCTLNPKRHCNMCDYIEDEDYPDLQKMIAIISCSVEDCIPCIDSQFEELWFKDGFTEESVLKELHEISSCPACILAAIRQSGVPPYLFGSFDFKKEKDQLWADINDAKRQEGLLYYAY
jgi:hypothetical protein